MTFWRPILRLEGERSGSSDVEEQTIVFTFGGVDVVSMSYPLAMSTQASLLSQVEVLFGVEQLIDRTLAVTGRREEGTETCDDLYDQLVAIVPRGDAHTPKTNRSARRTLSFSMMLPR